MKILRAIWICLFFAFLFYHVRRKKESINPETLLPAFHGSVTAVYRYKKPQILQDSSQAKGGDILSPLEIQRNQYYNDNE